MKPTKFQKFKKTRKSSKSRQIRNDEPYFYMFSKKVYKKNNKVIENVTQEVKNNILYTKGYINGKRINNTKKYGKIKY
jgi:hypothetical protein